MTYISCHRLTILFSNFTRTKRVTPDLHDFLSVAQGAIQGILCSRLLFHIHEVNEFPGGTYLSQMNSSRWVIEMKTPPQQHQKGNLGLKKSNDKLRLDFEC